MSIESYLLNYKQFKYTLDKVNKDRFVSITLFLFHLI